MQLSPAKRGVIVAAALLMFGAGLLAACEGTGGPASVATGSPIAPGGSDTPTTPRSDTTFQSPLGSPESGVTSAGGDGSFNSPVVSGTASLDKYRNVAAAQSFSVALTAATAWRPSARWYGVVPYTSMERAFALPLDDATPTWFFRFGVPRTQSEYIVEVMDGKVRGTNQTVLPAYVEVSLSELEPLSDTWTLLDSDAVLKKYLAAAEKQPTQWLPEYFDFRLVHPKGKPNPVWTLYNAADLTKPIFVMDAVTGEPLPLVS